MIVYEHIQKGSRYWFWFAMFVLFFQGLVCIFCFIALKASNYLPYLQQTKAVLWIGFLTSCSLYVLLICGSIMMSSLTVQVNTEEIHIRFGGNFFKKDFLVREIIYCKAVQNEWWYGCGVHWTFGGWLYNIAGYDAVELTFRNGKRARIGTDEPEKLAEAIRSVLSAPSS